MITYSDASYGNLIDGVSSGRGHVIFLADENLRSAPLAWTVNKVKRVVTSTLAAEALSLHACINHAIYIRHVIAEALNRKPADMQIIAYTDSNNLSNSLHSTTLVSDQRLRIDIGAIKQAMSEDNVAVKWLPKQEMLADSLTKKGATSQALMDVPYLGRLPTSSTEQ